MYVWSISVCFLVYIVWRAFSPLPQDSYVGQGLRENYVTTHFRLPQIVPENVHRHFEIHASQFQIKHEFS